MAFAGTDQFTYRRLTASSAATLPRDIAVTESSVAVNDTYTLVMIRA